MRYFLELPDGRCFEVDTPERAQRYAELLIILLTGRPPVRPGRPHDALP